ncbi:MAG: GNAT family N-acetyltransferase [Ignavibacteriaceae bacterium]|nr:GNAT family N-acetyltransferase [Ignavibacteriaceae bacterium]
MEIIFHPYKIRSLKQSDTERICEYLRDFDIVKYLATVPFPYLLENAVSFIHFANEMEIERKEFHFAIANISDDKMLGLIGVKEINFQVGTCEIGYWLGKEHHNKGIITQAINKISQYCFSEFGLGVIKAIVFVSNIASVKALGKAGFNNAGFSEKLYCNTILKEKMYEFQLSKEKFVPRETGK